MSHARLRLVFAAFAIPLTSIPLDAAPQCPSWQDVGSSGGLSMPYPSNLDTAVYSAVVLGQGASSALYVGGEFNDAGGAGAVRLARWDGSSWSALGGDTSATVTAVCGFDDGSGTSLYAGGGIGMTHIGGVAANGLARWDGSRWHSVGLQSGSGITALAAGDIGSGPSLFAGGNLNVSGPYYTVGRWDGTQWSSLGTGLDWTPMKLCVADVGSGPTLFAIRYYFGWGGAPHYAVARWTGSTWIDICHSFVFGQRIEALAAHHAAGGTLLCIGGVFTDLDGFAASNVATWDGTSLGTLGSGPPNPVAALAEFDDGTGSGPELVAGLESGPASDAASTWNGSTWNPIGTFSGASTSGRVLALAVFDDSIGLGPGLYALGGFDGIQGTTTNSVAVWRGCDRAGVEICAGDGSSGACPCGNGGAPGRGCENSAATGGARLAATGLATRTQDTLSLTVSGELPSALSVFFQGSQQIAALRFGDGLRCVGGRLKRLYTHAAASGIVTAPLAGEPSVSQRSASLGDPVQGGARRFYQIYYRDPSPGYCAPPNGNTWNVSSGVRIDWLP